MGNVKRKYWKCMSKSYLHALSVLCANMSQGGNWNAPVEIVTLVGSFFLQLTVRSFWAVVPMIRTKPRCHPGMPAGRAAVVPAGLRWCTAPTPHAGMEAAGTVRLLLKGIRRRATKVRRWIVSRFRHTDTTRKKSLPRVDGENASQVKVIFPKHAALTWPCFAPAPCCRHFRWRRKNFKVKR